MFEREWELDTIQLLNKTIEFIENNLD